MGIYQIPATGRSRIQESATAPLQSPLAGKPSPQTNTIPGTLCGPRKHPWNPLESLDPRRIPPHREIPLELEAVLLSISLWHSLYLLLPIRHPPYPEHLQEPSVASGNTPGTPWNPSTLDEYHLTRKSP